MSEKPVLVIDHPMRRLKLAKVVVNMAVGESGERLANAVKLLEELTGQKPSLRQAKRTIKEFGIRKGENIACVVTLRGEKALNFLRRVLETVKYTIKESSIDDYGNISFGIREHILLPGTKYDPSIGIFGFDVNIVLERPGFRVSRRRRKRNKIGKNHRRIPRSEAKMFLEKVLGVKVVGKGG
ncbi:MAG: 50S ribosomal protein L5 [Thermoproteales archaeon]|nr:50S ribosomal protein L5 [Thermoproteales archaeon]RLE64574.1 MAG: 50S ribosomal protein L5 [Thermoprotei archaeon]